MIRDWIVVGLLDAKLSEKLQLDQELTLSKAVTQVRQAEAIKQQQALLRCHLPSGGTSRQCAGLPRWGGYTALTISPILSLFDQSKETVVSADASSCGLGAVLLQRQPDGELTPISYISRSLTPTEQRYAQIEKEALAFTWACERFSDYLLELRFHVQTDHKSLVPLFTSKPLDELPVRVQRFRLRMMRFDFSVSHVPGKSLLMADALSRAPCSEAEASDILLQQETAVYVKSVIQSLPATDRQLERIQRHQEEDEECRQVAEYSRSGWPSRQALPGALRMYHWVAMEIVIPASLRLEMLDRIHTGHLGITKCWERAKQSVWWPGLSRQLEELVKNCSECRKTTVQRSEPLIPSTQPKLPW